MESLYFGLCLSVIGVRSGSVPRFVLVRIVTHNVSRTMMKKSAAPSSSSTHRRQQQNSHLHHSNLLFVVVLYVYFQ
jgi:hypothetical protein